MKIPILIPLRHSAWPAAALTLLILGGCAGVAPKHSLTTPALTPLPPLASVNAAHYVVRSELSDVRFLVYRAGPLASFGHNHVIRAGAIQGNVYLNRDFALSGFELSLPVKDFRVDQAADRAVEGADFAKQPSDAAIAGTLKNMLGPAELDAVQYPNIHIRSVRLMGPEWGPDAAVRISLHGVQREITVPIAITPCGTQLIVTGTFEILQSDFGITPFSFLGGGLQVADTVKVRFHIVAEKV